MSLRFLLNDEDPVADAVQPRKGVMSAPGDANDFMSDAQVDVMHSPRRSSSAQSYPAPPISPQEAAPPTRSYYRSTHNHSARDPPSLNGKQEESLSSYADERPGYAYEDEHGAPAPESLPEALEDEHDVISKRKRKGAEKDTDYQPSRPRRVRFNHIYQSLHVLTRVIIR